MRNIDIKWVMTADPATIGPDDHIETACSRLEAGDIHHLPSSRTANSSVSSRRRTCSNSISSRTASRVPWT